MRIEFEFNLKVTKYYEKYLSKIFDYMSSYTEGDGFLQSIFHKKVIHLK